MHRKISLLFLAAMAAFTFQTAMAMDEEGDFDDIDEMVDVDDEIDVDGDDDDGAGIGERYWRHERGGRGGPGSAMRHPGPMMHRGPGMQRGPGMHRGPDMRHGMHHGMMGKGRDMGFPRYMDRIQLDAAQKTKVVDILTNAFRERLLAQMEARDAMLKLREHRKSDTSKSEEIIEANKALGAAKGKMDVLKRKTREELRAVLTTEQVTQLEKWENDRPRWGDRREDGKRKPGPERGPRLERGPGAGPGPRP